MGNTWFPSIMKQDLRGQCTVVCGAAGNKVLWTILCLELCRRISPVSSTTTKAGCCGWVRSAKLVPAPLEQQHEISSPFLLLLKGYSLQNCEIIDVLSLPSIVLYVAHTTSLHAAVFYFSFRKKSTEFLVAIIKLFTAHLSQLNKVCWRIFALSLPIPYSV